MMNVIRTGNSVFRTNSKILYKHAVTPQSLLCSSSGSGGDKSEKDGSKDGNNKKAEVEKPVDVKMDKKMQLQKNRHGEGKNKITELLQSNNKPDVKMKKHFQLEKSRLEKGKSTMYELLRSNKSDVTMGSLKGKSKLDEAQELDQVLDEDTTIDSSDAFKKPQKEPIKVPLASKPMSQKKSSENLMTLIHEAAVELGVEPEETKKDLLQAYMSIKDKPYNNTFKKWGKYSKVSDRDFKTDEDDAEVTERELDEPSTKMLSRNIRLNIFTESVDHKKTTKPELKMWQKLYANDLQNLATSPPRNYFDALILWTKQGKLWHFPIDNEQGMDLEKNTSFTEHIFLEKHLDPWCPQSGPLRHFMELVTVGLSKNPYLSVEQKKEHIMWYRDYFEKKRKLLEEIGALDPESTSEIQSN